MSTCDTLSLLKEATRMSDCIFCKIINGEIPAYTIYEDEHLVGFLDIMPAHEGHTLLIPKEHHTSLWELPHNTYTHLMNTANDIARKLDQSISCKRVGLALEGFDVAHAHLHIIPLDTGLQATLSNKPQAPIDAEALKATQDAINAVM